MEFENVNNINIAIEASAKKMAKSKKRSSSLFTAAVHRLKKWLRRAKPDCACAPAKSEEELENEQNEVLEAKNRLAAQIDSDLRQFRHVTHRQTPQGQVPS